MGRNANVKRTPGAKKGRAKKQFNATLPEQLVLDFNSEAEPQGRDELLKNILLGYLEKVRPDAKSVQEHRNRLKAGTDEPPPPGTRLTRQQAAQLKEVLAETAALRLTRESAARIVAITTAVMRKGPKRSVATAVRRHRKVSSQRV